MKCRKTLIGNSLHKRYEFSFCVALGEYNASTSYCRMAARHPQPDYERVTSLGSCSPVLLLLVLTLRNL
jgi:hypothetical protein